MTLPDNSGNDETLVQAALCGDRESFSRLVRKYQHLVFGVCRSVLGNREDALDAAQDTFVSAYKNLRELRCQGEIRPWLRQIAHNACRMRLRARRPEAALDEQADVVQPHGRKDREIEIDRALAELSVDHRTAVLLFYFEGRSVRDIAQFLGIPETTVMSRLRNARSQLRRELEHMFEEPIKRSSLPEDFADRIPIPYDEYGPFSRTETYSPLSVWRRNWLLSAFQEGSSIQNAEVLGHDWEQIVDRAVSAQVRTPDGTVHEVVLRMSGRKDGIRTEAALLPVLAGLGLNVPRVVLGPVVDPELPGRGEVIATTPPIGRNAMAWAVDGGIKATDHACEVVMDAIELVKSVTAGVEMSPVAANLERCTLRDELERVVKIGGPWMNDERVAAAVRSLAPAVEAIDEALVFSDSGIGPNVRVDEKGNLAGFDTFAWARIEDPHYQISKYWTYDCWPIRRAGFVERYLLRNRLSMQDFAPRLGVRALVTLQREIPVQGGDAGYREDMLGWLRLAVKNL